MPNEMTKSDASRIQSSQARGGGDMSSSGFAARAQSAGDRHANTGGAANGSQSGDGAGGGKNVGGASGGDGGGSQKK